MTRYRTLTTRSMLVSLAAVLLVACHQDAGRSGAELDETRSQRAALDRARDSLTKEVMALRAAAHAARESRRRANERLDEVLAQSSAQADGVFPHSRLALVLESMSTRADTPIPQARLINARWGIPSRQDVAQTASALRVAEQTSPPSSGTRRAKELEAARQALEALRSDHEALKSKLAALEKECAAVKEQVQTLSWANEVLVKELDVAYAKGGTGKLPEGTRGIYVLREGESLSGVAKAFYGDASRWPDIVAANKSKIPDPDHVKAGTVIVIPE